MKKLTVILSAIILIESFFAGGASAAKIGSTSISSAGACVMDYETGEILYHHYGNVPRVPASMTKIMNLYCVYEALQNGEITLQTTVPISKSVYNKSRNSLYQSVLPLNYNETYTVDEMMGVVITYSASGAAVALAELVGGGSEAAFVERMNNTAKRMGINAYYYDSCGIANNQVSPIAMATLARNIIKDYPDILTRSAKKSVYFHGRTCRTTNHLLDTYYYKGADGLKTGTTSASGYCFCGTAVRNGRRMISVTMSSASTGQRFIDTARLLDYGFMAARDRFETVYFTHMRTFINNFEVPTFMCEPYTLVVSDDLEAYGFDCSWHEDERTLYLQYNPQKEYAPTPMDYYRNKNGVKAFEIIKEHDIKVAIVNNGEKVFLKNVYVVPGYTFISADEIGKIYSYTWNETENTGEIIIDGGAPN